MVTWGRFLRSYRDYSLIKSNVSDGTEDYVSIDARVEFDDSLLSSGRIIQHFFTDRTVTHFCAVSILPVISGRFVG